MISKENLRVDYYLLLNIAGGNLPYFSLTWAKSLTKYNSKMQHLKPALDLNIVSKRKIGQFDLFSWLLNVKHLVLSNGSEHERNVIQWH